MPIYRVTWVEANITTSALDWIDGGSVTTDMVREFADVDQAYSFYQQLQGVWWATNVTWEHAHDSGEGPS